jgi:hypothetical protein
MPVRVAKAVGLLRRREVLALLLLAIGLALGVIVWQTGAVGMARPFSQTQPP